MATTHPNIPEHDATSPKSIEGKTFPDAKSLLTTEWDNGEGTDEFVADALEGLGQLDNATDIPQVVQRLNKDLLKMIKAKEKKRKQWDVMLPQYVLFTTIFILLSCAVAYYIVTWPGHH